MIDLDTIELRARTKRATFADWEVCFAEIRQLRAALSEIHDYYDMDAEEYFKKYPTREPDFKNRTTILSEIVREALGDTP